MSVLGDVIILVMFSSDIKVKKWYLFYQTGRGNLQQRVTIYLCNWEWNHSFQ